MLNFILPVLLFLSSVFLILLVLIQRGRGGGLAGAFGGLGGQSAFGTKAGDLFTRITIGVAAFWIILCAFSVKIMNDPGSNILNPSLGAAAKSTASPGATQPAGAAPAATEPGGTAPTGTAPADGKAEPAKSEAAPAAAAPAAEAPAAEAPAAAPAETPAAETPEKK